MKNTLKSTLRTRVINSTLLTKKQKVTLLNPNKTAKQIEKALGIAENLD
jgi:hypothetical protein